MIICICTYHSLTSSSLNIISSLSRKYNFSFLYGKLKDLVLVESYLLTTGHTNRKETAQTDRDNNDNSYSLTEHHQKHFCCFAAVYNLPKKLSQLCRHWCFQSSTKKHHAVVKIGIQTR